MAKRSILTLAAAALAFILGCASDAPRAPADKPATKTSSADQRRARETSGGGYHVTYVPSPDPIPLNAVYTLEVRVFRDAAMTTPATGVSIAVDAAMPAHHHGMNLVPRAEGVGDGVFKVSGMLFHMPGYWEIYVDVREAGREERARFEVEL